MTITTDEFLAHHGIVGMKWGKHKAEATSSDIRSRKRSELDKNNIDDKAELSRRNRRNAAIILGSAVGIAAIALGASHVAKHMNVPLEKVDLAKASESTERAKKLAKAMAAEPVSIVHASRGKEKGFTFPAYGGLTSPLVEYDKAGFQDTTEREFFKQYGDRMEKVAARFNDPQGRLDAAGRIIPHEVMLPEDLAKGVTSLKDVQDRAWPLIKDTYEVLYNKGRYDK